MTLLLLLLAIFNAKADEICDSKTMDCNAIEVADSIDPDDEEAYRQGVQHEAKRLVQQKSALDYVMESRYHSKREDFRRRWYDHMFIEIGSGVEKLMPTPSGYKISSMVSAHANVGKEITPYHTFRLGGAWHHGSQYSTSLDFNKADAHLDYLFNVSSFMYGYDPTRRVEVSTLLGAGSQFSWTRKQSVVTTPMFYAGLQFKVNTGAYSYIGIEPYIGLTTRKADLSDQLNWRRYNVYYGVNVNLAHYFSNNHSDRQRDSIASRAPWFIQFATGAVLDKGLNLGGTDSWGKSVSAAVGKWFSPVFGLRMAYEVSNSSWMGETIEATEKSPRYELKHYSNKYNMRVDVMLNPFGFRKNFKWESKYGMYLLGGIQFGTVRREKNYDMERTYTGVGMGMHLWTRLSRDLQLYVEPRYSYALLESVHKVETENGTYKDGSLTVDLGLTMMLRRPSDRREFKEGEPVIAVERPWSYAFLLGLPLTQTQGSNYYHRDKFIGSLSYNALTYLKYSMNEYSSLRLSADYMTHARDVMSTYYDFVPSGTDIHGEVREGLWNRRSHILTLSLAYGLDMTKLLSGTTYDRSWQAELFLGPAFASYLGESVDLSTLEEQTPGHVIMLAGKTSASSHFAFLGGAQVTYNINRRLSFVCIPRLIFIKDITLPGYKIKTYYGFTPVGGISLGLQYRL